MFSAKRNTFSKNLFIAATVMTVPFVVVTDTVTAEVIVFDDAKQSGSDMQWAVDNGYIDGYVNQKHLTTGKHGNWLNPGGNLTEAQLMTVLLRYKLGIEEFNKYLEKREASEYVDVTFPYDSVYLKGYELNIMTQGYYVSRYYENKYQAYKAYFQKNVTRGGFARALVSMHYRADVTLKQAVEFMYTNNLTNGIDPAKGQNVENFGADAHLTRAHLVAFLKKYDSLLQSENVVDIADFTLTLKKYNTFREGIFTTVKQTAKTEDLVGKTIKTKYGERAYQTKTQAEYDAVMQVVDGLKLSPEYLDRVSVNPEKALEEAFNKYKAGERGSKDRFNPQYTTSPVNLMLVTIERDRPASLIQYIKTYDDYVLSMRVGNVSNTLAKFSKPAPNGYDPKSAYDLFVKNWDDCTSYAYGMMAIYDRMGIDGFVLHSPARVHDYYVVNLHGKWYAYGNGMEEVTVDFLKQGDRILEAPNNGIKSLPAHLRNIYKPSN